MREPIWLTVSAMTLGIAELPGPATNPVIARWAADLKAPYSEDSEAWCALWLNRLLLACQLPTSGAGYNLIRARTFGAWGYPLEEPTLGAVMVFARPGGAHVGLYLGERRGAFRIRGGNTGNAVADTWIRQDRLLAMRWPFPQVDEPSGRIVLNDAGEVSTNEA